MTRPRVGYSAAPRSIPGSGEPGQRFARYPLHALRVRRPVDAPEDLDVRVGPTAGSDGNVRGTVYEGHSFEAVETVLSNPFLPGIDPVHIHLPAVPRVRSPQDDEAHFLRYWQVHLWETLLRYRRAFGNAACPERIRAGYPEVDRNALRIARRVTSGFPLAPVDLEDCRSALRLLKADAVTIDAAVSASARRSAPTAATG